VQSFGLVENKVKEKSLNILIVNSARHWIGEAARCIYLTQLLNDAGHNALLLARKDKPLHQQALKAGLPVKTLNMTGRFTGVLDACDVCSLLSLIRKRKIDVVHTHRGKDHWLCASALRLIPRSRRPVLIRTRHVVTTVKEHLFNKWLFCSATDSIIAVSEAAKKSFGTLLENSKNASPEVIYAGIDNEMFSPSKRSLELRSSLGVGEGEFLIGLIGRYQRIKGQEVFLESAAKVIKERPNIKFLMCGREAHFPPQRYKEIAASLGIESNVIALSYQENIETLIASLDVGVVASLGSEGSSRIAFEYMASGVPVIATKVGCLPEIIEDKENGLLISNAVSASQFPFITGSGKPFRVYANGNSMYSIRPEMCIKPKQCLFYVVTHDHNCRNHADFMFLTVCGIEILYYPFNQ